jgi:D-serine deaminase-like pyridoxal phosphate-dependent protein
MTLVGDLDTPVPLVEVGRLERNLSRMAERIAAAGAGHLPHTKTHKTREIAERQLAHGAAGLTVAKLGEAEAMVDAGFDDLLIAYPLVGEAKMRRLAALLERARVRFTVDSADGARAASGSLAASGQRCGVLIEVEAGSGRTGVSTLPEVVALAGLVASLPGLELDGVLTFGRGYVEGTAAQQRSGRAEGEIAVGAARAIEAAGLGPLPIVTSGSTPTSPYAAEVSGVTHVRAGNYVYHDLMQVSLGVATYDDCALTILATVVSHPSPRRYVVDAGIKTLAGENYGWGTYGRILGQPDVVISWAAEEHGVIDLADEVADPGWRIGDRVRIVPDHACGVSNMHDEVIAVDGEQVVDTWRVISRGRVR